MECMLDMRSQNLVRETEQAPDVVAEAELLWHAQCINSIPDTDTSAEKKSAEHRMELSNVCYRT